MFDLIHLNLVRHLPPQLQASYRSLRSRTHIVQHVDLLTLTIATRATEGVSEFRL